MIDRTLKAKVLGLLWLGIPEWYRRLRIHRIASLVVGWSAGWSLAVRHRTP